MSPTGPIYADDVSEALAAELPTIGHLVQEAVDACVALTHRVYAIGLHGAPARIWNQIANDFSDALVDLNDGRGRSAMRAGRSLAEHAINLRDVLSSPTYAERYEKHAVVAAADKADAQIGLRLLKGKAAKVERQETDRLRRRIQADVDAAIAQYGPSFRSSWAGRTLRERADAQQLAHLYQYFRIASAVGHGAAAGANATIAVRDGRVVHRTGPALSLCPDAFVIVVESFADAVATISNHLVSVDATAILNAVDGLCAAWPDYRQAIQALDRQLWPEHAPPGPIAVYGVKRDGTRRWFLHDAGLGLIVEAEAPVPNAVPAATLQHIDSFVGDVARRGWVNERWLTVAVMGVRVQPKPGAHWRSDLAILVAPDALDGDAV